MNGMHINNIMYLFNTDNLYICLSFITIYKKSIKRRMGSLLLANEEDQPMYEKQCVKNNKIVVIKKIFFTILVTVFRIFWEGNLINVK